MQIVFKILGVILEVILDDVSIISFLYLLYKGIVDIMLFIIYLLISDGRASFPEIVNELGVGTPSQCYRNVLKSNFMRWASILMIFMLTLSSIMLEI
jgi:hypothetical protein